MKTLARLSAGLSAVLLSLLSLSMGAAASAAASSGASVGVVVDPSPTTILPPSPPPPSTTITTVPAPTTSLPPDSVTSTTLPQVTTTILTTDDSLADELPDPEPVVKNSGFVSQVKSAANTTKQLFKGIASGKPVADVAQQVLPADVAAVVVPAVRTASTFVFPIGLAGAVVAFLVLQQRVDSSDPKLTAAPLAHDDDVVTFS